MNKYNVRAIRKELDDCVRHNAWKKFRSKVTDLRSKPELFEAVVTSKTSKRDRGGSLLHALIKLNNNSNSLPLDLVTEIATAVPWILRTIDSSHQTPLHIALALERRTSRSTFPEVLIGQFLELNATCLGMEDRYGDTPLLKAAKGEYDIAYLKLLLRYDSSHLTPLMENKRKKRTPLWYVASNELQYLNYHTCCFHEDEVPENLRLILLATYFALKQKYSSHQIVGEEEEEWKSYLEELNSNVPQATAARHERQYTTYQEYEREQFSLILRAFAACIDLLGKYSVKILDFFLNRESYKRFITTQTIDVRDGNYMLHQLCAMPHIKDKATSCILLEQLLRHSSGLASLTNVKGNLPLHLAVANGNNSFVSQLLSAFPAAVRHPNHAGELPLHIALKNCAELSLAHKMWKAYPTAAEFLDGETRLYPFQLVALRAAGSSAADDEDECGDSNTSMTWLSFVYELLQAAPQTIGVKSNGAL